MEGTVLTLLVCVRQQVFRGYNKIAICGDDDSADHEGYDDVREYDLGGPFDDNNNNFVPYTCKTNTLQKPINNNTASIPRSKTLSSGSLYTI